MPEKRKKYDRSSVRQAQHTLLLAASRSGPGDPPGARRIRPRGMGQRQHRRRRGRTHLRQASVAMTGTNAQRRSCRLR